MRRSVGLVLMFLGVLCFTFALLLRFYVTPNLLVTPIDQFAQSFAPGTGTVFNPRTQQEETNVDLVAHRTLRGDVAASSDTVGVWDESVVLQRADGTMVNTTTDRVAWDRKTGEAVNCCDESVDGKPTKHAGLSYKFPFHAKKQSYQFFDTTAKKAFPMTYQGSEQIQGLTVYRYQQRVPPTQIATTEVPGSLVGESTPTFQAPRFYDNTRTVWIEPLSGVIVKGQEQQHQVFRNAAGEDKVTLVQVTLTFDERTQKQQGDLAKDARKSYNLAAVWGPLALGLVGLILIALAVVPLRRADADGAGRSPGEKREPVTIG